MHLVQSLPASVDASLPEIAIRVDRQRLAKRRWRAAAEDGAEFGFELESPLRDGDAVWASGTARYVVRQDEEPALELSLDVNPATAATIGWTIGNLHFPVETRGGRLLAPDDEAVRQALGRLGVPFRPVKALFRPSTTAAPHSHGHDAHSHPGEGGHSH